MYYEQFYKNEIHILNTRLENKLLELDFINV